MKRVTGLMLMFTILTGSVFARPCWLSDFFMDGFVGVNFINETQLDFQEGVEDESARGILDTHPGIAVGGALGRNFSKYLTMKGELTYRLNLLKNFTTILRHKPTGNQLATSVPIKGEINKTTLMGNTIVNLPFFEGFTPYLGFGAGYFWGHFSVKVPQGDSPQEDLSERGHGEAFQGLVGFDLVPGEKVRASFEYCYLAGTSFLDDNTISLSLQFMF